MKCIQPPAELLIIPSVLALLLWYLQALDDSLGFNKGMLGDKLSYTHSFPIKKTNKEKKNMEHRIFWH